MNALQIPTFLLCYNCNRQTKSKPVDENKTKHVHLASSSDEKQIDKEKAERIF